MELVGWRGEEAGTDRRTSQKQVRVLAYQGAAAEVTGRTGQTRTGIQNQRERDIGLEFILEVSISLSSENDQKRIENVRLEFGT